MKELEETGIPGAGAPEHAHLFQNNTQVKNYSQSNYHAEFEIKSQLGFKEIMHQGFERRIVVPAPVGRIVKVSSRHQPWHPLANSQGFEPEVQAPVGPLRPNSDVDDHVLHILVPNMGQGRSTGTGSTPVHGAWW